MIAEIICNKEKKHFRTVICTPKSQTLLEVHIFYRKKSNVVFIKK